MTTVAKKETDTQDAETPPIEARSILFACNVNAVRSPVAAALVQKIYDGEISADSVGVDAGDLDPFAANLLRKLGADPEAHQPKSFQDINAGSYDVIVALTHEAFEAAEKAVSGHGKAVEHWQIDNPSETQGARHQIEFAYDEMARQLKKQIQDRFAVRVRKT